MMSTDSISLSRATPPRRLEISNDEILGAFAALVAEHPDAYHPQAGPGYYTPKQIREMVEARRAEAGQRRGTIARPTLTSRLIRLGDAHILARKRIADAGAVAGTFGFVYRVPRADETPDDLDREFAASVAASEQTQRQRANEPRPTTTTPRKARGGQKHISAWLPSEAYHEAARLARLKGVKVEDWYTQAIKSYNDRQRGSASATHRPQDHRLMDRYSPTTTARRGA